MSQSNWEVVTKHYCLLGEAPYGITGKKNILDRYS